MVIPMDEVADDVAVLQALLQDKFGVNDKLTFRQKHNLDKMRACIHRQLTSKNFIHKGHVINVD